MKSLFTAILLTISVSTFGQKAETFATPIQTVDRIFKIYIKASESPDSKENKDAMAKAFQSLQLSLDDKDLPLIINVWMYYNPTDFPARELIYPILNKHKSAALNAIDKRLKKKRKWETKENAPYSDLVALRTQLSK